MTAKRSPIPFFTDNDVSDSVGDFLSESGHVVYRLRDVMLADSKDPVVAAACRESGLVLVTHNIKDFKRIVREFEVTNAQADSLCRIELGCQQYAARARIEAALTLIEAEWRRLGRNKIGLRAYVGDSIIRLHR